MKKRLFFAFALTLILVLAPISVSGNESISVMSESSTLPPTEWYKLFAARHYYIGGIWVSYDDINEELSVEYTIFEDNGCLMTETHLAVAGSFEDIPQTRTGNPKVGLFPYAREYDTPTTSDTYLIPMTYDELPLFMAAHAVVICPRYWDQPETAWGSQCGECCDFPGRSWATWFHYPHIVLPLDSMVIFSRYSRQP